MTAVNQKQYMDRIEVGQSFVHPVTNENMEVLGKIGTGASANVFKIADSEGKLHALKSINYGRNDLMRELAESELKLMQKLEHSHIVKFEGAMYPINNADARLGPCTSSWSLPRRTCSRTSISCLKRRSAATN